MTDTTATAPRFTVEYWQAFWADPLHAKGSNDVLAEDIVGYWPGEPEPVRGRRAYTGKIAALLRAIPDLRLEAVDSATHGDLIFIHYLASGTGPGGPFETRGIDRVRVRDGVVVENVICYDTGALPMPG